MGCNYKLSLGRFNGYFLSQENNNKATNTTNRCTSMHKYLTEIIGKAKEHWNFAYQKYYSARGNKKLKAEF